MSQPGAPDNPPSHYHRGGKGGNGKRAPRNNAKIVVPKALHTQAIAISNEGYIQADGTLRHLRKSQ